jgi:N-acetylglutamate synthase-like GNAT family acetyltransferase
MTQPDVEVREAVRADASAISALLREAFNEFEALYTPEALASTVPPESGILARMEEGPVWVAERGQSLVGTVAALRAPDCILVRGMAVHPSARGLGIGHALLERTERFAREVAVQRLSLYTTPFLKQAIRLYQAAGFQFTGEADSPHGTELLRMVKELAQSRHGLGGSNLS